MRCAENGGGQWEDWVWSHTVLRSAANLLGALRQLP